MEYLLIFLEGFVSFISPCLLPMLPIYVSYFAGSREEQSKRKIKNAIGFVLGFTLVFFFMSIFASTFGKFIGENLKYIKLFFGILVIVLGMNYMGVLKIKFLNRSNAIKANTTDLNFIKSVLFGIVFSISWTPCVGALLSSALLLISQQQDVIKGIILILIYSMGLGIPFVLSVILMDKLKNTFDYIKKNYDIIVKFSGIILILAGIYMMFL